MRPAGSGSCRKLILQSLLFASSPGRSDGIGGTAAAAGTPLRRVSSLRHASWRPGHHRSSAPCARDALPVFHREFASASRMGSATGGSAPHCSLAGRSCLWLSWDWGHVAGSRAGCTLGARRPACVSQPCYRGWQAPGPCCLLHLLRPWAPLALCQGGPTAKQCAARMPCESRPEPPLVQELPCPLAFSVVLSPGILKALRTLDYKGTVNS